jgi:ectoine hydroxylase-related dioxygenase (phytanoyl-CoA dioxygenase family)
VATRGLLAPEEFAAAAGPLWDIAEEERLAAESRKAEAMRATGERESVPSALPFVQVHNPSKRHSAARRLALSPALLGAAAALLGVAGVRLYQDSLFWKRPGNGITAWHADLWTVPLDTNNFITVWLPLHRVGEGGSPLFYQSGTHCPDFGGGEPAGAADPGQAGESHTPLEEGDATWHHGWTLHGAPPLGRGGARLAYTASYYSDEAPVLGSALEELTARRRGHSWLEAGGVHPSQTSQTQDSDVVVATLGLTRPTID